MINFAIFSLLHKQLNSSQKFPMTVFSLLHKKPVIYHTKFPTYLFLTIFPTKFIIYPKSLLIFFTLSVPPSDGFTRGGPPPPPPPLDATVHFDSYPFLL